MPRAAAQAAQEERAALEGRFYAMLARARPDIKSAALRRIAREAARRYQALERAGIDVVSVVSEVADNLDSALTVEENVGLALDILDRYARLERAGAAPPDTQIEEARRRYLDLIWTKKEFGRLSEEEEEELKALEKFLEKYGKLPAEPEEENWREVFGSAPLKAPAELVEVECEAWLPEPGSVRLNGEELYKALAQKARALAARGLL